MTRIGRLAGSLLVEASGAWYLVGHLKQPCDFAAEIFAFQEGSRAFGEKRPDGAVIMDGPT